jgi:hypothetical protein
MCDVRQWEITNFGKEDLTKIATLVLMSLGFVSSSMDYRDTCLIDSNRHLKRTLKQAGMLLEDCSASTKLQHSLLPVWLHDNPEALEALFKQFIKWERTASFLKGTCVACR